MKFRFVLLSFLLISFTAMSQEDWKLEKNEKGITVYTRKMPDSKLKEYKGAVLYKTSVDKLVKVFKNEVNHDKFLYKAKVGSVKMVKKITDNDFFTYMVISIAFVTDRDAITHYTIGAPDAKGAVTINIEGAADLLPKKEGFVRVPKMKGYWRFEPQTGGNVKVTHQAYSSPGGNVSDGMANTAAVDAPFSMLTKLKLLVE